MIRALIPGITWLWVCEQSSTDSGHLLQPSTWYGPIGPIIQDRAKTGHQPGAHYALLAASNSPASNSLTSNSSSSSRTSVTGTFSLSLPSAMAILDHLCTAVASEPSQQAFSEQQSHLPVLSQANHEVYLKYFACNDTTHFRFRFSRYSCVRGKQSCAWS